MAPDPDPAAERGRDLDDLDDALVEVRRALQRPGYRHRLLDGLSVEVSLATLRLLRAVQRTTTPATTRATTPASAAVGDAGAPVGAPSIGEVAEALAVDPSTASRLVDRAVAGGLLERRACADDRRRTRLHLSERGRRFLDEVTERRRDLLREITFTWSRGDVDDLVGLLRRLREGFDALEGAS